MCTRTKTRTDNAPAVRLIAARLLVNMPVAKTITRTMTITVNMPEAQVNVAKPRLIVAGRQVKRRFTAGLMLQGSGE